MPAGKKEILEDLGSYGQLWLTFLDLGIGETPTDASGSLSTDLERGLGWVPISQTE